MNYHALTVQRGKGFGKSVLGFPTANATAYIGNNVSNDLVGAWVVIVSVHGLNGEFKGFAGVSKTGSSKSTNLVFETHILDFSADLYDKKINITLIKKIRDAITFKSLEESKEQIKKDFEVASNWDLKRTCDNCKFFVKKDYGYSNYTVEGTDGYCSVKKHPIDSFEVSSGHMQEYEQAKECSYFYEGECWSCDVDGDEPYPTDEWIKSELRDFTIKYITDDKI
jgi:hypothetical protein